MTKITSYNLAVGEEKPHGAVMCIVSEWRAGQSPLCGWTGAPVFRRSPARLCAFLVDEAPAISIVALSAGHPLD